MLTEEQLTKREAEFKEKYRRRVKLDPSGQVPILFECRHCKKMLKRNEFSTRPEAKGLKLRTDCKACHVLLRKKHKEAQKERTDKAYVYISAPGKTKATRNKTRRKTVDRLRAWQKENKIKTLTEAIEMLLDIATNPPPKPEPEYTEEEIMPYFWS